MPMKGADLYHVKVRFGSEPMTFYVNPDDTIESLKTKVGTKYRIPRDDFDLSKYGYEDRYTYYYNNSWTLKSSGIKNGQVLYAHLC